MLYLISSCALVAVGVFWLWRASTRSRRILAALFVVGGLAGVVMAHPANNERDEVEKRIDEFCSDYAGLLNAVYIEFTSPRMEMDERNAQWTEQRASLLTAAKLCLRPSADNCATSLNWRRSDDVVKSEFERVEHAFRTRGRCEKYQDPPKP